MVVRLLLSSLAGVVRMREIEGKKGNDGRFGVINKDVCLPRDFKNSNSNSNLSR